MTQAAAAKAGNLDVTEGERVFFLRLFLACDSEGTGHVTGAAIKPLFTSSGVERKILAQVLPARHDDSRLRVWALLKVRCDLRLSGLVAQLHGRGLLPDLLELCIGPAIHRARSAASARHARVVV
jgi:hypothetical protein